MARRLRRRRTASCFRAKRAPPLTRRSTALDQTVDRLSELLHSLPGGLLGLAYGPPEARERFFAFHVDVPLAEEGLPPAANHPVAAHDAEDETG